MARNRPLIYTASNSAAQFVLGMVSAQRSTSFTDLILISSTDIAGGSFFITATYFGYMLGCLLSGALFGRIKSKALMVAIASMLAGLFTALTPQCTIYAAMLVVHALVTVCTGTYETTVYAEEIQAWEGSSESALQFLSFCHSIGGVISPLITRPFLAPKVTPDHTDNERSDLSPTAMNYSIPDENSVLHINGSSNIHNISSDALFSVMTANCTSSLGNGQACKMSAHWQNVSNQSLETDDVTSNLQYAYLITGAANVLLSLSFFAVCVHSISKKRLETRREKGPPPAKREVPRATSVRLMAIVCAYYLFHAMGIDCFVQYLFYFVVTHLDWSKENGVYLMSLYGFLGIPVKLLLVVIYKRVKIGTVLLFSMSGILIFMLLFVLAGQFHIHALMWVSCSGVAISQAPIYGGGISWVDGNIIPLGGKGTSALMISASIGVLSAPIPLGFLMKNWSLMSYPFWVLVQVSISATIFLVMSCVVKPAMDRKYGPLRPQIEHNIVPDSDAMDEMIPSRENSGKIVNNTQETSECI